MDIDLLSKMVKELILDRDKVVLPGLGCFVAEIVPASFSDKGYTINPPYRRLSFRTKPDVDDVLVDFYASSNNLDKDIACRILGDFVSELRNVIYTRKVVIMPGLGRLRATKENNIFFIADEDLDIYPEGIGLEPVSLKTHQETVQEVSDAVAGLKAMLQPDVPEPESEQIVESEPEQVAEPETAEPESLAEENEPESPAEASVPESEQTVESEPEQVAEPETAEPESPAEENEPEPQAEPTEEPSETVPVQHTGKRWWVVPAKILVIVLIIAAIALAAYVAAAHFAPDWIDSILYTPEELEILNRSI